MLSTKTPDDFLLLLPKAIKINSFPAAALRQVEKEGKRDLIIKC